MAATAEFHAQAAAAVPRPPAAVVEAPLLFEAGGESVSRTIAWSPTTSCAPRGSPARPGGARGARGPSDPQSEKQRLATYVVVNNGSVEELRARLAEVLERLRR